MYCNLWIGEALGKKNTGLFENFSQFGGGVFPIPKTYVNFLYAKLIPMC